MTTELNWVDGRNRRLPIAGTTCGDCDLACFQIMERDLLWIIEDLKCCVVWWTRVVSWGLAHWSRSWKERREGRGELRECLRFPDVGYTFILDRQFLFLLINIDMVEILQACKLHSWTER
jgi:hypothetical protein